MVVDDFQIKTLADDDGGVVRNDVEMMEFPRTSSISHLWEMEYLGSISQLLNQNSFGSSYDNQNIMTSNAELVAPADSMRMQVNNQTSMLNQPVFVNSLFEF